MRKLAESMAIIFASDAWACGVEHASPRPAKFAKHDGRRVIYGETTRLGAARLAAENITFNQIPYYVKMR